MQLIAMLGEIIAALSSKGHSLFPFTQRTYSESLARKLSEPQILILKKMRWIDQDSIFNSYGRFLCHFEIEQQVPATLTAEELDDLEAIASLLHKCCQQNERMHLIKALWQSAAKNKESMEKALLSSDLQNVNLWDPHLTHLIADFL